MQYKTVPTSHVFDAMFRELDTISEYFYCMNTQDVPSKRITDVCEKFGNFKINLPQFPKSAVYVDKDMNLIVKLAVAGYSKNDIKVEIEDSILNIKGFKAVDKDDFSLKDYKEIASTIKHGSWEFPISLSSNQDVDKIETSLSDGMLVVKIPIKEEAKPVRKTLEIK